MEIKVILWTLRYFALGVMILLAMIRIFHIPLGVVGLITIVRDTNDAEIADILDPHLEAELRARMSTKEFRAEQQRRMVLAFEYLRRKAFNTTMILNMAIELHAEWQSSTQSPPRAEAALI